MMMLMILTMVLGYELKTAVGTSVFIMTFSALTGAVSHFVLSGPPHYFYTDLGRDCGEDCHEGRREDVEPDCWNYSGCIGCDYAGDYLWKLNKDEMWRRIL